MTIDQLQKQIDKIKASRPDAGKLKCYIKVNYGYCWDTLKKIEVVPATRARTPWERSDDIDTSEIKKQNDRVRLYVNVDGFYGNSDN